VQPKLANCGKVIELPRVGGLHHRYEWQQLPDQRLFNTCLVLQD
jgi:hypothetical protein